MKLNLRNIFYLIHQNPFGMLVISAGKYKETRLPTTIQGTIELIGGIILSLVWGLNGLVLGSLLSNLYRDIEFLFFAPRHLTHMAIGHTVKLWIVNTLVIGLAAGISTFLWLPSIGNFLQWVLFAAGLCLFFSLLVILVNALLFRNLAHSTWDRLMNIVKRRR